MQHAALARHPALAAPVSDFEREVLGDDADRDWRLRADAGGDGAEFLVAVGGEALLPLGAAAGLAHAARVWAGGALPPAVLVEMEQTRPRDPPAAILDDLRSGGRDDGRRGGSVGSGGGSGGGGGGGGGREGDLPGRAGALAEGGAAGRGRVRSRGRRDAGAHEAALAHARRDTRDTRDDRAGGTRWRGGKRR